MEKPKIKSITTEYIRWLTVCAAFGYSTGACCNFGTKAGIIIAAVGGMIFKLNNTKPKTFAFFGVITALFISGAFASFDVYIQCLIASFLTFLFTLVSDKINDYKDSVEFSALELSVPLYLTVLVTNDYFGIGAKGYTAVEMIKSYISFGFHPNWRGILYGTIVMVIMITLPRKFKTIFGKVISPALTALIITFVLNIFLIPNETVSPIHFIENATASFCFDARMPLSSPAVVLIVGAWQSVEWSKIKNAFSDIKSFIIFFICFAFFMLTNPVAGMDFSLICFFITKKSGGLFLNKKNKIID